jgi:hypothetical protein
VEIFNEVEQEIWDEKHNLCGIEVEDGNEDEEIDEFGESAERDECNWDAAEEHGEGHVLQASSSVAALESVTGHVKPDPWAQSGDEKRSRCYALPVKRHKKFWIFSIISFQCHLSPMVASGTTGRDCTVEFWWLSHKVSGRSKRITAWEA